MPTREQHLVVLFTAVIVSMPARVTSAQQPSAQQPSAPPPSGTPPAKSAASPLAATAAPPSAAAPAPKLSFTVKPYGLITLTASYLIGNASNNPDVPEWATQGPSAFYFTARQTRIGVRGSWVTPPSKLHVEKVDGLIEADFYGGFLGQGIGYFFPVPRLRLATATVEWHTVRFSFGQDWAVLAPLNPDTALHTAVPGFTTSGNLWGRIPQLRADGVVSLGKTDEEHKRWRLIWAAALVAEVQADAIATAQNAFTAVRIPQGGENALAPAGQARVAIGHDLFDKALELGVSGHLGNREIAFTGGRTGRLNGAVAVDVTLPLPFRLSLKGEAFWGSGLDAFFGGITQGIAFTTTPAGAIATVGNGIADGGGWAEVSWEAFKWLILFAAGGADKPKTEDLLIANAATNRTLNAAFYGEVEFEFARGFALWLEYNFMHTEFQAAPTQRTHVLALSGQLTF